MERDSTNSDIGSGNFNYLYFDNTDGTNSGATPQSVPNYFAVTAAAGQQSESGIWDINVSALTIGPQWVNSDASTPTTETFVQSNHLYAGGDSNAFNGRFPAPVTPVTLHLDILSSEAVAAVPEPASLSLFMVPLVFAFWSFRRRSLLNQISS